MNDTSLVLIAYNTRSAHNVGAFFRTASGAGVEKIFLTGVTMQPAKKGKLYKTRAEKDLAKTALGAEDEVSFEYHEDIGECIKSLKEAGYSIIGLEQNKKSVDYRTVPGKNKIALLVGTEVEGLSEEVQMLCDALYEIPMAGKKNSLNVSVAAGIALYALQASLQRV